MTHPLPVAADSADAAGTPTAADRSGDIAPSSTSAAVAPGTQGPPSTTKARDAAAGGQAAQPDGAAAVELFVYYRAAAAQADAVQRLVSAFQQALTGAHPGLQARLLRRPPGVATDPAGPQTWMECYRREVIGLQGGRSAALAEPRRPPAPALASSAISAAVDPAPAAQSAPPAPAGIDAGLAAEIEAAAGVLAPLIDGDRHVEAFVACA